MMGIDDLRFRVEAGKAIQQIEPQLRMHLHDYPLLRGQLSGFHKDVVGNSGFAYIVEQRAEFQRPKSFAVESEIASN